MWRYTTCFVSHWGIPGKCKGADFFPPSHQFDSSQTITDHPCCKHPKKDTINFLLTSLPSFFAPGFLKELQEQCLTVTHSSVHGKKTINRHQQIDGQLCDWRAPFCHINIRTLCSTGYKRTASGCISLYHYTCKCKTGLSQNALSDISFKFL